MDPLTREAAERAKAAIPRFDPHKERLARLERLAQGVEEPSGADPHAIERRMFQGILGGAGSASLATGSGMLRPTVAGWNRRADSSTAVDPSAASSATGSGGGGAGRPPPRGASFTDKRSVSPIAVPEEERSARQETLIASMTARLSVLERSQREMRDALVQKDKDLLRLRVERDSLRAAAKPESDGLARDLASLRDENARLRAQIHEMETFLNDYGLVWVGRSAPHPAPPVPKEASEPAADSALFRVNAGTLRARVQELNALAGEGVKRIERRDGAHRLVEPESVPFTLFADGFLLWRGPFRPFAEEANVAFVEDLLEGYFPLEFKERFPDGVVLQFVDKSAHKYDPSLLVSGGSSSLSALSGGGSSSGGPGGIGGGASAGAHGVRSLDGVASGAEARPGFRPFVGDGRVLHGSESDAAGDDAGAGRRSGGRLVSRIAEVGDAHIRLETGAFLSALPPSAVTRSGHLVPVRSAVADLLRPDPAASTSPASEGSRGPSHASAPSSPEVVVADTAVTRAMRGEAHDPAVAFRRTFRAPSPADGGTVASDAPSGEPLLTTPHDITTIQVRSDSGRQTIVVKLRFDDTIGDLRRAILSHRTRGSAFEIRTAFPNRSYTDDAQTLRDAGLTPNAAVLLRSLEDRPA